MSYSRVLVTGGAGFIGSHVCKALAKRGIEPLVYDNLSTGHSRNVKYGPLVVGDILDSISLDAAIRRYRPDACIHFAALAYVGESVIKPYEYYRTNVQGTLSVLERLHANGIKKFVFSSSCATYGLPDVLPIIETTRQVPISPYGSSKLMGERIIADFHSSYGFRVACLRYFNAAGADLEGELREEHDPETHLIPRCLMAAIGGIPSVEIFGDDYDTADGTCVRDFIHVNDLALGHILALDKIDREEDKLFLNLGSGTGFSVLEILTGIENILGRHVPRTISPRRPGDPPVLTANVEAASRMLNFKAVHSDLKTILQSAAIKYGL